MIACEIVKLLNKGINFKEAYTMKLENVSEDEN